MSSPHVPAALTGLRIRYDDAVERELTALERSVDRLDVSRWATSRWTAIKLLEEDPGTVATVAATPGGAGVVTAAAEAAGRVRRATGEEPALLVADDRFAWAHELAGTAVTQQTTPRSTTERLDAVLTNRWAGIPIFLALMWIVFTLVTHVAGPSVDWVDGLVAGPVSSLTGIALTGMGLDGTWVASLLIEGVIGGVGAVLVFVPILVVLYAALGLLEDSGYMARAAFLLDRLMRPIGLTGKSFLPLLLGFGCNVPGVYATRVLEQRRERVLTSLLMPFVTCAARLPVYVLLAAVFFPSARGTVVFAMYVASIVVVLGIGAALDRLLLRDERTTSFVLELPPYRRPSVGVLWTYVSQRVRSFVSKAGTVILGCALAVWTLLAVPVGGPGGFADTELEDSAFAAVSRAAAPTLAPAGLGSWEVTGTLVTGFVAKEVVVSTLEQVYDTAPAENGADEAGHEQEADLAAALRDGFAASSGGHAGLAAAAFLAFVLLYVPCMATVAAIRHELGARWAVASVIVNLVVAWTAAVVIFQLGRLLGPG